MKTNDSTSTFLFPLRTNVQYFAAPEGFLSLEGRIKQALVLYEQVVFESGLYGVSMGPDGAVDTHIPITLPIVRDRRLSDDKTFEAFSVWVQPDGPNTPPRLLFSSSIEYQFQAEFHTLVNRLTTQFGLDGLAIADVHLSHDGKQQADLLANEYLRLEDAVLPAGGLGSQHHIVKSLFRDLVLTSALGCASCVDPLHAPLLGQVIYRMPGFAAAPGRAALRFLVPHVAALPWDQIAQIRSHPAMAEFRRKLIEAESTVRHMLPDAPESEIQHQVDSILGNELIKEIRSRLNTSGLKLVGSVVFQVAGAVNPVLGAVQTVASVGKEVMDFRKDRRSWLAVLMRLSRIDTG